MRTALTALMLLIPLQAAAEPDKETFSNIEGLVKDSAPVYATTKACGLERTASSLFEKISATVGQCDLRETQLIKLENILANGEVDISQCDALEEVENKAIAKTSLWELRENILSLQISLSNGDEKKACAEIFKPMPNQWMPSAIDRLGKYHPYRDALIVGVVGLYREVEDLIDTANIAEHPKRLYKNQLEALKPTCSFDNMATGWGLKQEGIKFLILLDEQLKTSFPASIDAIYENVEDVIEELEKLIDFVKISKLNNALKHFSVNCLEVLLFHLRNAHVFGPTGIRDAYVKTLLELNSVDLGNSEPEEREIIEKIFNKIKNFNGKMGILRLAGKNIQAGVALLKSFTESSGN